MIHRISVSAQPGYLLFIAISIMLLPLKVIFAWMVASFVHELGHILCIVLMKKDIYSIRLSASGAIIQTDRLANWQEWIAALSGPLAGILLLPLTKYMPMTAMFALFQSVYNLMPIYPMDGGRVVLGLFRFFCGYDNGIKRYGAFMCIFCAIVLLMTIYISLRFSLGVVPLLILLFFFIKVKFSCKESTQEVE